MSDQPGAAFVFGGAPDEQPPAAAVQDSVLERLRAVSRQTLEQRTVSLPVPVRPGFEVVYCTFLPREMWEVLWGKHSAVEHDLARAVLVHLCRGITMDGQPWTDAAGAPVTFTHPDCKQALGADDAWGAVDALYVRHPDVLAAARSVMDLTGWTRSSDLDPTGA